LSLAPDAESDPLINESSNKKEVIASEKGKNITVCNGESVPLSFIL